MIKPLTSLRFFFALLVFLSHYNIGNSALFSEGYIGVSFFFILSGFILSYSYEERILSGLVSKSSFYVARFARIYPLHILTFTLALLLALIYKEHITFLTASTNIALLQSWIPLKSYYFTFNSPSWSISDEMFFYAVFPFLILFFNKPKQLILKLGSIIALAIIYGLTMAYIYDVPDKYHAWFYINPLFRLIDFVIGIGIYYLWKRKRSSQCSINFWPATILEAGSILLLVAMIMVSYNMPQIIRYACYYWMPMSIIIYVFANQGKGGAISRFLSLKWLVIAGEISFAFYMMHVIIMRITDICFFKLNVVFGVKLPDAVEFSITLMSIFVLSLMSFYWFETPLNIWIKRVWKQYKEKIYGRKEESISI